MFSGIYNGSQKHAPDLEHVLNRSWENGLKKIIITGTSLSESQAALDIARTKGNSLVMTVVLLNFIVITLCFNLWCYDFQIDYSVQ